MSLDQRSHNIASELVYLALTSSAKETEFAFELKGQKAIVRLELFSNPADAPDRMYVSLNPPGDACKCCDGTGVQTRTSDPPLAAM